PGIDSLLMTDEELMTLYYKSVGRGSVLLLNATPDTSGLIPASHVARYKAFGKEIASRFDVPVKRVSGRGNVIELTFSKPTELNHTILQEDLSKGQRVMEYVTEYSADGGKTWTPLYKGSSVGNKKIDRFPTVQARKMRVRFTKTKATPEIVNFAVYNVKSALQDMNNESGEQAVVIGNWDGTTFDKTEWKELTLDLTPYVTKIGQYEIRFQTLVYDVTNRSLAGLEFKDLRLEMYGQDRRIDLEQIDPTTFRIVRSQQTLDEFKTILRIQVKRKSLKSSGDIVIRRITY
ncbi:MAG: discoidin domain-containing protein, partial [Tannerella sp.]|nr:discoidin domain-containing protein [Tannerella sp.]